VSESPRSAPPLDQDPTEVEFFQAVRLLRLFQPDRDPVGFFGDPEAEIVRFQANPDPSFPASELQGMEWKESGPPRLTINVMGLNGPLGTLPLSYSQLVTARLRDGDGTIRAFLDLFNHRMASLFYRAWEKHRFAVGFESGSEDRLGAHLADLVGLGTAQLGDRVGLPIERVLSFTGLLGPAQRSAVALEELVSEYFDVPATIEQFVGGWYRIEAGQRTRMGEESGPATQLGLGVVAGDEIWDPYSRIRLRLGPLRSPQYQRFLPGGDCHDPLAELVRLFINDQFEIEVQLVLAAEDVRGCGLGTDPAHPPRLGWDTWIRTGRRMLDGEETILAL
jgi:type VI secretion system protein ImpH